MIYGSLGLSIFMIISIFIGIVFLFRKLKYINLFNVSIYITLAFFWIGLSIFREQLFYLSSLGGDSWEFPIIIAISSLVPVFVRIPLGKFSQKIKSRKIPILLMFLIFLILSAPFIFEINIWTFLSLGLGIGFFSTAFGMENQYFVENWSIRNIFFSVGLLSLLPMLGVFFSNIFHSSFVIYEGFFQSDLLSKKFQLFFRWILLGGSILNGIIALLFFIFNKEKKETIKLDDTNSKINKTISLLKLKDTLRICSIIFFISIANQLIFRKKVTLIADDETWTFVYILIFTFTTMISVFISLFLIQKIKVFTLTTIAQIMTFIGISFGLILWFTGNNSIILSVLFISIFSISITIFENTTFGVILHFDSKNKLLVLGIWLSIRSFGYTIGDTIGGEVEYLIPSYVKWIILVAFILVAISIIFSLIFYKKNKVIFDVVDIYENSKSSFTTRKHIWKSKKLVKN